MSRLNALRTGWLPYTENDDYDACCKIYDSEIRDNLATRLQRLTAQVVSHPTFSSQFTHIKFHNHVEPRWLTFQFDFNDDLVDDVLCTPDCVKALTEGNVDPTQLLTDLRNQAHTLDAWTRSHVHYIHSLVDACRDAYGMAMEAATKIQATGFDSNQIQVRIEGSPPNTAAKRPGFRLRIDIGVIPAQYTCPDCDRQVPDLPGNHTEKGLPVCPHCQNDIAPLRI